MELNKQHIDPIGLLPKVIAGEATPEEKKVVDEWLLNDQANRDEYDAIKRLWDLSGSARLTDDIDLDKEWHRMNIAIIKSSGKTRYLTRVLQIAAAIVLVTSLAFLGAQLTGPKSVTSQRDMLSAFRLPDGTSVTLNAGSKITYRKGFGTEHRHLKLSGEAYFEVPKNSLPFIISAGDASVRVTGTEFNVKSYRNKPQVRVTVVQGNVMLYETSDQQNEAILAAGETGIFNRTQKTVSKEEVASLNDISWKTGIIDFHNTTLTEVADIISNTYHVKVEIDPVMAKCLVTVHFNNQELDPILEILESTLDLIITRKGNRIILTGKGC